MAQAMPEVYMGQKQGQLHLTAGNLETGKQDASKLTAGLSITKTADIFSGALQHPLSSAEHSQEIFLINSIEQATLLGKGEEEKICAALSHLILVPESGHHQFYSPITSFAYYPGSRVSTSSSSL